MGVTPGPTRPDPLLAGSPTKTPLGPSTPPGTAMRACAPHGDATRRRTRVTMAWRNGDQNTLR